MTSSKNENRKVELVLKRPKRDMGKYVPQLTDERLSTTEENIRLVRQAFNAFNTGDITKVNEFISEQYFNHESQSD
jgi:hypothetical protein